MNAADAFAQAAEEHRRAVADCADAIRKVPPSAWETVPASKKWTPAQIAEHLAVSYEPLLSELEGGRGMRIVVPWWKRRILRWKFLPSILAGTFPRGVPAPQEIRPTSTAPTPEAGARRLTERAGIFVDRFARAHAAGRARLTHPYLGTLSDAEALRFLTSHLRHHGRQLP